MVLLVIIRQFEEKDYEAFGRLFEETYDEYLEFLRHENPEKYLTERQEGEERKITRARFEFYLETGTSFVAEEEGRAVGCVASQTVRFVHGVDRLLWIEYIVVQPRFRRRGIGLDLLNKLIDHARRSGIDKIYTTISPDNEASIELHHKAGFDVKDWKIASHKIMKSNTSSIFARALESLCNTQTDSGKTGNPMATRRKSSLSI